MFLKFAVPVLGAAAAIVLAMVIYGNLNPAPSGTPSDTPLPSPAAVTSPEPTPDPCDREAVEVPTPGTLDVMWCVPRGTDRVVIPFTFQAPVGMGGRVLHRRGGHLLPTGRRSGGAGRADRSGHRRRMGRASSPGTGAFDVSEPETVEIAGGEAVVIDVTLADGANPDEAPPLIDSSDIPLSMHEGDTARVWILEGQGEAVAFATDHARPGL